MPEWKFSESGPRKGLLKIECPNAPFDPPGQEDVAEAGMVTGMLMGIADAIEAEPEAYSQRVWCRWGARGVPVRPAAAAPACVGGWACWLAGVRRPEHTIYSPEQPDLGVVLAAARVLGVVVRGQADGLFAPVWPAAWFDRAGLPGKGRERREPVAEEAAAVLRGMANDGEVWDCGEE